MGASLGRHRGGGRQSLSAHAVRVFLGLQILGATSVAYTTLNGLGLRSDLDRMSRTPAASPPRGRCRPR